MLQAVHVCLGGNRTYKILGPECSFVVLLSHPPRFGGKEKGV
jgi:hypothetical protein